MNGTSPFTLARFEYEHVHLYFLQRKLFARLERPKPIYLIGSRGTGKTTLLKTLSWSERLENESLRRQLRGNPFRSRYIGIYLKLPEIQLGLISRWAQSASSDVHANFFAHYLDLVWIEELLSAISELVIANRINIAPDREQACIADICSEDGFVLEGTGSGPKTLREFARAIRRRREDIELCASTGVPPAEVVKTFRMVHHIGGFGRQVAEKLGSACNAERDNDPQSLGWHFKICMDEGECLDAFQQRVLNTMLRLSKTPLFFVVSFVSYPPDPTSTLIANLTLQQADRELVPLDDMSESEFRELVEGVATVRAQEQLVGQPNVAFDVYKTLGALDINGLLLSILRESVSPFAKQLLEAASAAERQPFFKDIGGDGGRGRGGTRTSTPIYQTYLVQKLSLKIPVSEHEPRWKRRKQDSAELRKRIVAAYLSICNDVNADARYASADVVLQTSDNCVRDFLSQVDEIFITANVPLARFLDSVVDPSIQDRAIKAASRKKYDSLPVFGVNNPTETRALVDGLARLTAMLQRGSRDIQHLKSSERGRFVLNLGPEPQGVASQLLRSLREAAEAGFLRLLSQESNPLVFRVHTSLSPAYGFSYRGAYYDIQIDWQIVDRLRRIKEERELEDAVAEMFRGIENVSSQIDMFRSQSHA